MLHGNQTPRKQQTSKQFREKLSGSIQKERYPSGESHKTASGTDALGFNLNAKAAAKTFEEPKESHLQHLHRLYI